MGYPYFADLSLAVCASVTNIMRGIVLRGYPVNDMKSNYRSASSSCVRVRGRQAGAPAADASEMHAIATAVLSLVVLSFSFCQCLALSWLASLVDGVRFNNDNGYTNK